MPLENNDPRVRDLAADIVNVKGRMDAGERAQTLIDEVDDLVFLITCAVDEWEARKEQKAGAKRAFKN